MSNTFSLVWDRCSETVYLTEGTNPEDSVYPTLCFHCPHQQNEAVGLSPLKPVRRRATLSPSALSAPPWCRLALPYCSFLLSVPRFLPSKRLHVLLIKGMS